MSATLDDRVLTPMLAALYRSTTQAIDETNVRRTVDHHHWLSSAKRLYAPHAIFFSWATRKDCMQRKDESSKTTLFET